MEKQNVTLSLPAPLLKKLKVVAAKRNTSMSRLMEGAISKMVLDDDDLDERAKRMVERMRKSPARGFGDTFPWDRNEQYERVR